MTKELINRKDIENLSGVCSTKTALIIKHQKYGFPKPEKCAAHNETLYDKQKVLAWFKKHDMKAIRIRAEPIVTRAPLDIKLAQQFLFGR